MPLLEGMMEGWTHLAVGLLWLLLAHSLPAATGGSRKEGGRT